MKRFLSLFLFTILFGGYAFSYDFSAVCESGQTLYYNITSSTEPYTVEVTSENASTPYYSTYPTGNLVIPESVEYNSITYSVTSIGSYAFYDCSGLTSVIIPNSITSIGSCAFYNCSGLSSITIPNSVTSIGQNTPFGRCRGLTSIIVEQGNAIYDSRDNCSAIIETQTNKLIVGCMNTTIPNSVTSIGEWAFSDCSGLTGTLTIPNSVTSIGNYAFSACSGLTSVTIPESVTSIGWDAFVGCSGLTTVNFNATNCTTMGSYSYPVFNGCTSLTTLNIGENVTNIPEYAFYGCSGLTLVTIPNSVTSIGEWAFSNCSGLTEVTIPNSVTSIGNYAFSDCSGLTSTNFNATNCSTMGSSSNPAFLNCTSLQTINIGENVTNIPEYAFYGCSGLTTVNYNATNCAQFESNNGISGNTNITTLSIGGNVETIPNSAFYGCSGLTGTLTIPNSVTSIGEWAFSGCSGLTGALTIPNSVTSIEDGAFSSCNGLTTVNFNATNCTTMGNSSSSPVFNNCTSLSTLNIGENVTNIPNNAFQNCSGLTSVTIGTSVTSIGNYAFSACSGLTTVNFNATNCTSMLGSSVWNGCSSLSTLNFGENVTNIPNNAFQNCSGLTTITIPDSVASIGSYAFQNCSGLTSVTIPNSVTSIGGYAFQNCSGLTTITIPDSVASIGSYAFQNCSGLITVNFNATNCTTMGNSNSPVFNGCTSFATLNIGENVETIPNSAFSGCSGLTAVTIPNSVTRIGEYAFYDCDVLTSVTIPNSVTSIGSYAFYSCSGLTTVNFNATNCTSMGSYPSPAFSGCTALQTLNIGENVTNIPAYAFKYCSGLTSVTIPNSVTSIGKEAFYGCSGLTSVTLPNSVTSIGDQAFIGCSGIATPIYNANCFVYFPCSYNTEYTIQDGIQQIAGGAFYNCSELTSIIMPNSVTNIGNSAFSGCSGLTSVTIPDSVTSIGDYAFRGCSGLAEVTIGNSVTSIGNYAFSDCSGLTSTNYNATNCRSMLNAFTALIDTPSYIENFDSYNGAQSWWARNDLVCTTPAGWYVYTNSTIYAAPHITTSNHPYSSPNALSFCNDPRGNTSYAVLPSTSKAGLVTFYAAYESIGRGTLSLGYVTSMQSNVSSFVEIQVIPATLEMTFMQYEFIIPNNAYLAFRWMYGGDLYYAAVIDDINVYYEYENLIVNGLTLNIGENVVSIPDLAFNGIPGLSAVNFNATNCTGVIDNSLFDADNSISKITIGENVTTIPNNAFRYCTSLDSIICSSSNPPAIYANTFDFNSISNVPIIVPCGTVGTYNNADFWYNFRRIQQSASCPVPYTITVLTSNPNYGTVTGGGEYLENTTATLTATPYEECMFVNWNDGSTDNPREITVTEDATYIATFVRGNINTTVYAELDTTACGSYTWNDITYTESGDYEQIFTAANTADSIVTLHLTILPLPEPGITVDGILDACNPETTSVTLSAEGYDSYIWSNGETVESVVVTTPGSYYVEAVDETGCHGFSEEVTIGYSTILTEAPQIKNAGMNDNGFNVIGWRVTQTEGIASFEIYREDNATDVFSLIAVVTRPGARSYIDSTANPSARAYRYKICAVDACGGMSPMSEPHKTMHLTINQGVSNDWNLIWSHYEGLDIRSYKIYRGTTKANMVVIGEVPSSHNLFTDSSNPYNIGFFYKVAFVKNTRSDEEEQMLTSNIVDNGYIVTHNVIVASSNPIYGSASGSGVYPEGTEVEIEATANAGYEFSAWNDGSTVNPRSVTITSDTLFIANFVEIPQVATYTITVYSSNPAYGTVSGGGTYAEGTEILLVASANNGYEFVAWSDGNRDNPRTITVTEDAIYIATFVETASVVTYTITALSANPSQGTVTGGGTYPEGTEITIEAIANDGYQFVSWSDNCTDNPRSITVVSDAMYIATFVPATGIAENAVPEISVYPNPVEDILNITSSVEITEIEIVNVMGQVVLHNEVNSENAVCDVAGLPSGVYMVRIYSRPFAPSANAQGANAQGTAVLRKFVKE